MTNTIDERHAGPTLTAGDAAQLTGGALPLLTARDTARILGVTTARVRQLCRIGKLKPVRLSPEGNYRFSLGDVARIVAEGRE